MIMREILFRSKKFMSDEWTEGVPLYTKSGPVCLMLNDNDEKYYVLTDTLGQYTGLTDKNGKKVFEGDMLRMDDDEDDVGVIIFKDGCFRLEIHGLCGTWTESGFDEYGGGYGVIECEPIDYWYIKDMEVIGNIHDNPELLKGEEK